MKKGAILLKLVGFLIGAVTLVVVTAAAGFVFLKTRSNGFSARAHPSAFEQFAARSARNLALRAQRQAESDHDSTEVLAEARAHWADHCSVCHANDGSGTEKDAQDSWRLVHFIRHLPTEMEKLNPKSPDDLEEKRQEHEVLKGRTPGEPRKEHHHH